MRRIRQETAGVVVGIGLSLTLTALVLVGFVLVTVVLLVLARMHVRLTQRFAAGAMLGASLLPLWVAWANRAGPGTVVRANGSVQLYDPWPWLGAGVLLVVGAVVLEVLSRRGGRSAA